MSISTCGSVSFTVNYASLADFVDEVAVIPPKMLQTSQTTAANSCNITNATYTYDGQKRLLQYTINGLTYAYTAWDNSGRPTIGTVSGSVQTATDILSYNDGTRTMTRVQSVPGASTTTTYVFNSDGNPVSEVVVSGGTTVTTAITTTGTGRVCK